jgi:hypothetical protein
VFFRVKWAIIVKREVIMMSSKYKTDSIHQDNLSEDAKRTLIDLELEGIFPSPELLADIRLLDSGKLTKEQFLERAIVRAKA